MVNTVEARSLARSILEARREGRKLKPLTNTRLLSPSDALKIQDALIDLRIANHEQLLGWALVDPSHVAPIMTSAVVDDRVVMGIPSQAVDVRVEPVVVLGPTPRVGLRAMDRLIAGGLSEDSIAAGHGLVSIALGEELPSTYVEGFEIRVGRTTREIKGAFDSMRDDVQRLLQARGRSLGADDIVVSAALLPGEPVVRGKEATLTVVVSQAEVRCSLRHL